MHFLCHPPYFFYTEISSRDGDLHHLMSCSSLLIIFIAGGSVADPGCLSRIPDPDFYPSRIPDPKTTTKERGEKKVVITFNVATNFTKL
jgi:hypothetical protein